MALERKRDAKDFNFRGVWFPDPVQFQNFHFSEKADFRGAFFKSGADFSEAKFDNGVDFSYATFEADAYFEKPTFKGRADFHRTKFSAQADFDAAKFCGEADFSFCNFAETNLSSKFRAEVNFGGAIFTEEAYFRYATFHAEVNLRSATFRDYVRFGERKLGKHAWLNLQYVRIEKPDHMLFHNLTLRPHWFVNVNSSRFEFANVAWDWRAIDEEVESLRSKEISPEHDLLTIACRHLAVNSEENNRYEDASRFRYMAMDTGRRKVAHGFAVWKLSWWYWFASGYGERVWQAAFVLLGLWLLFASIFFVGQRGGQWWRPSQIRVQEPTLTGEAKASEEETSRLLGFGEALIYSAGVITLQKPEPLPANKRAKTLVLFETIVGPVQAALLALAIRRKFMR